MFAWIAANVVTLDIALVLIAAVVGIILLLRRDKRKGKCTCGASCAHCAMAGSCHEKKK